MEEEEEEEEHEHEQEDQQQEQEETQQQQAAAGGSTVHINGERKQGNLAVCALSIARLVPQGTQSQQGPYPTIRLPNRSGESA